MTPGLQGLTILVLSIVFIGYGRQTSAGQEPSSTASSAIRETAQKLVSSANVVSAGEGYGHSEQSEGNEDRYARILAAMMDAITQKHLEPVDKATLVEAVSAYDRPMAQENPCWFG
jgi:hypothetical protein